MPADLRLVEVANFWVDEAMLIGESVPVPKQVPAESDNTQPSDQYPAAAFSGTPVTQGKAMGLVVATGERSALGRIGATLSDIAKQNTPIQHETRRFAHALNSSQGSARGHLGPVSFGCLAQCRYHAFGGAAG